MDGDRDTDLSGFTMEGAGGEFVGVDGRGGMMDDDGDDGKTHCGRSRKTLESASRNACPSSSPSSLPRLRTGVRQKRGKTINGEDILFAMSTLGFDNYVDPLKMYLQKYREAVKGDKPHPETFEDVPDDVLANALPSITTDQQGTPVLLYSGNSFHLN
ncbi:NFYB [Lepeophtheirus salmonis]|uniref:NFYB n=1 Tax=Lepeophtheirus salmonis TaxID=72036 RepID=A0A7R8CV72_LEPSM|nr:NFYB [Lepeophtheirus salmonis]CAF2942590.1 NFYB [Lepeophtheirus salmonis]